MLDQISLTQVHLARGVFRGISLLIFGLTIFLSIAVPANSSGDNSAFGNVSGKGALNTAADNLAGRHSGGAILTTTLYLPLVYKAPPTLKDRVSRTSVSLPHPLAPATGSFCTWDWCTISPRLYHEPLADGRTLLGWTDSNGNGHVSIISTTIEHTFDFSHSVRGLATHDNGDFAVLLWNSGSGAMSISKRNAVGGEIWTTNIQGPLTVTDFWLGGSRLTYGNGKYAAYFTVRGVSGWVAGHFGDQLTYVDDHGVVQPGGWEWGCSHSMAQLVSYHPDLDQFAAICASDCYSSKGILIFNNHVVYTSDGNCGGFTSAQLGQVALSNGGWKLVFSTLDRSCCDGHGVGLATIDGNFRSSYTWLTDSNGAYERDPALASLGSGTEQYLVGWITTNDDLFWLGVIDGQGNFLDGPEEVTSKGVLWGNRDDSFRSRGDGSVSWVYGEPGSTTLYLFRFIR